MLRLQPRTFEKHSGVSLLPLSKVYHTLGLLNKSDAQARWASVSVALEFVSEHICSTQETARVRVGSLTRTVNAFFSGEKASAAQRLFLHLRS